MTNRIHAALMIAIAGLAYAGWVVYWTTDVFVKVDDPFWNRYEDTFVASDLLMGSAFLATGALLLKKRSLAVPFGIAAGGAMIFLGSLDVLFNVQSGHYRTLDPVTIFEIGINVLSLTFGLWTIVRLWRWRNDLTEIRRPAPARTNSFVMALFRTMCRINIVLCGTFGLLFLAAPTFSLELLGLTADTGVVLCFQLFGSSLVYVSVISWWCRDSDYRLIVRGLSVSNCVQDAIMAILVGTNTLQGRLNGLGWVFFVVFLLEVAGNAVILAAFGTPAREESLLRTEKVVS